MKQTYTQDEILDVFEAALDQIETELLTNSLLYPPLSEQELAKIENEGQLMNALKKSVHNAMINGQTAGKVWMIDFFKQKLSLE